MYEVFEHILQSRHITAYQVAKGAGVSQTLLSNWKQGKSVPTGKSLQKIAAFLNVSVDYLMTGKASETTPVRTASSGRRYVSVPILAYVAAGIPIEAVTDILDYEEIPDELARGGEYFGLRIKGDSMEPEIMNGDYIIVRKQEDAENGETVVVLINGNEGTCKKIQKGRNSLVLVSNNQEYAPMIYTREEVENLPVRIAGKVVEIRRKL